MSEVKYYNNNPCKVLREVGEGFSEVVVFPHVQDLDMNGGDWCIACQVGSMDGAYPSHTCDPYQEVIDVVNSLREEEGVVIIADNRLIQDEMVEWKTWNLIKKRCAEMTELHNETRRQHSDVLAETYKLNQGIKYLEEDIVILEKTKEDLLDKVNEAFNKYITVKNKLVDAQDIHTSVTLDSNFKVNLPLNTLRSLIKDSLKLEQLENGGVDNWEWYGESIKWDSLDDLVETELKSYKVEIL